MKKFIPYLLVSLVSIYVGGLTVYHLRYFEMKDHHAENLKFLTVEMTKNQDSISSYALIDVLEDYSESKQAGDKSIKGYLYVVWKSNSTISKTNMFKSHKAYYEDMNSKIEAVLTKHPFQGCEELVGEYMMECIGNKVLGNEEKT